MEYNMPCGCRVVLSEDCLEANIRYCSAHTSQEVNSIPKEEIHRVLSKTFESILNNVGDTPLVRLCIANYTIGHMGITWGPHIPTKHHIGFPGEV